MTSGGLSDDDLAERRAETRRLIDQRARERDFEGALRLASSEGRAELLVGWDLTDDEVRALLLNWWTMTEGWSGDPTLSTGMYALLRRVGPLVSPSMTRPPPELDGELTLYRGNLGERPTSGSWTLDRAVAERFARMAAGPRGHLLGMHRHGAVPSLWQAKADATDVLGFFDDRDEAEIVVDANALHNVRLLGVFGTAT